MYENIYGYPQNLNGFQQRMPIYNNNMPTGQQIIKVNGPNGAQAYQQIGPNSSVMLLDETAPRVFLVQTDGAGYKTITPYKLEPYIEAPEVSNEDLLRRIIKLEEIVNEQSNTRHDKQAESNKRDFKKSQSDV